MIYFDSNATTALNPKIFEVMNSIPLLPLNASSIHKFGRKARSLIEEAREKILTYLKFDPKEYELIFCASGTEANNLVFKGLSEYVPIISSIEHHSVYNIKHIDERTKIINVDKNGVINLNHLEELLKNTPNALLSVMAANNETGIIQPIQKISEIAKKYNVIFHSDIIQIIGKINEIPEGADIYTISAHKFGGPLGIGAFIYKRGLNIKPMIFGGGQERGIRSGTENVHNIIAMAYALENLELNNNPSLRDYLEKKVIKISKGRVIIPGFNSLRLPNTSCLIMPHVKSQLQLCKFDMHDIAVSAGSACSSGKIKPSHTLIAMGYSKEDAECAIRVSLGPKNKKEEIDIFLDIWKKLFEQSLNNKFEAAL